MNNSVVHSVYVVALHTVASSRDVEEQCHHKPDDMMSQIISIPDWGGETGT
jgi:hypothetical protein